MFRRGRSAESEPGRQNPVRRSRATEHVAVYQAILDNKEPAEVASERSLFFWKEREKAKRQSTLDWRLGGTSITSNSA